MFLKTPRTGRALAAVAALGLASTLLLACGGDSDSTPTPTPAAGAPTATPPAPTATSAAAATSTPAPVATPTQPSGAGAPAAPSDLKVTGTLPDLHTPVPPGQGEQGRITVSWQDNSDNETGFRLYEDCGSVSVLTELAANETSIGPVQSCRPGRLGVAAFNAAGESAITWTP